ncbi:MAG TPA: AAA family ATPase [Myxococcota bacterium]|jgi:DNA-binding winged helix-turn-helix (wHTH) protein|nr:AAA family ATPase [Myxococcota bacterium]
MVDRTPSSRWLRFGAYLVDLEAARLSCRGRRISLQQLPFRVLALLLDRPGEVVSRDALRAAVWPEGTYVDFEHGLNTAVKKLRHALGDSAARPRFIETLPQRGYRFLARVEEVSDDAPQREGASLVLVLPGPLDPDERQRLSRLLRNTLEATGGTLRAETGDGMAGTYDTPQEAVRSAVALQQVVGPASGLQIGVALGSSPASRRAASRALAAAGPGEIRCTRPLASRVVGEAGVVLPDGPTLERAGDATSLPIGYEAAPRAVLLDRPPFVGRAREMEALDACLDAARRGAGGLALVSGEPGIGKSRLLMELGGLARKSGMLVLSGRCSQGDWALPYGPFVEALARHCESVDDATLRADLGAEAGVVARVVPELRRRLGDLYLPPPLRADEDRQLILDALRDVVLNLARRRALLLELDNLHWADASTLALLGHLARAASAAPLLLVGSYRSQEVEPDRPFARALGALRAEARCGEIVLRGLTPAAICEMIETVSGEEEAQDISAAFHRASGGSPFFLREILLDLIISGKLAREGGHWTHSFTFDELTLSDGALVVIEHRLSRLSDPARRLLVTASAFDGPFPFEVACAAAGLSESAGLDALDEALHAQLARPAESGPGYDFSHALFRQALYRRMTAERRARLHRRIAEELESFHGPEVLEHAAEIARHYHRGASLPGSAAGAVYALAASESAHAAAALEDEAQYLAMALELMSPGDPRRGRALARLSLSRAWTGATGLAAKEALAAATEVAAVEGTAAATDFLADAADAVWWGGFDRAAWELAHEGLRLAGASRDVAWARLMAHELTHRAAVDPAHPGIPLDSPDRQALSDVILAHPQSLDLQVENELWRYVTFTSRKEVLERAAHVPQLVAYWAGEIEHALPGTYEAADVAEARGQLTRAAILNVTAASLEGALGRFGEAEWSFTRAKELASRRPGSPLLALWLGAVPAELAIARGEGLAAQLPAYEAVLRFAAPENQWAMAITRAGAALAYADAGRPEEARASVRAVGPALERAWGWAVGYTLTIHLATAALWTLRARDEGGLLERNLRAKVLVPDFRSPHTDARLSMARLCALDQRCDEAADWLDQARRVLDAQGARPLRALCDFDEALMWWRIEPDDPRVPPLLDTALERFAALGMHGWTKRAAALREKLR